MKTFATAILVLLALGLTGCTHNVAPPPPSSEGADMSRSRQKAFDEAVDALHSQIHAPKADIAAVSQDDVTWADPCLGCAKTAERCRHVITPGYRIFLRVRDATGNSGVSR